MSVSSPCEICNRADVEDSCDRCGQLVCARHYDADLGVCVECATEIGPADPGRVPDSENMPDGVDTYRF